MKDINQREPQVQMAETEKGNQPRKSWRDRLYGKLKVSTHTMDLIIIVLVVLLAITLILGTMTANR